MPFAYIAIDVSFTDNVNHEVLVWMDMTGGVLDHMNSTP